MKNLTGLVSTCIIDIKHDIYMYLCNVEWYVYQFRKGGIHRPARVLFIKVSSSVLGVLGLSLLTLLFVYRMPCVTHCSSCGSRTTVLRN